MMADGNLQHVVSYITQTYNFASGTISNATIGQTGNASLGRQDAGEPPEVIRRAEADGPSNQAPSGQIGLAGLLAGSLGFAVPDNNESDDESGSDAEGQVIWKTLLEQVISFEDKCSKLIIKGDFSQAFGILSGMNRFPDSVRDVKFKLDYLASLMLTERSEQALGVLNSLVTVVCDKLNCDFLEILNLAERYIAEGNHCFALIFCMIAAQLVDGSALTVLNAAYKAKCMTHIREATDKLTKKCGKVRPFIREHVVPTCYNLLDLILATPQANDRTNQLQELQVMSFHVLEVTQHFAEDYHGRVKTLKEALIFAEGVYGSEGAKKRKYYGTSLHNLGSAYLHMSKVREATQALTEALECFNIATDFDDENEKKSHINTTTRMWRLASTGYF